MPQVALYGLSAHKVVTICITNQLRDGHVYVWDLFKCLGYFLRHASVIVPRKLSINETLYDIE